MYKVPKLFGCVFNYCSEFVSDNGCVEETKEIDCPLSTTSSFPSRLPFIHKHHFPFFLPPEFFTMG
jgi:hypothetical protein